MEPTATLTYITPDAERLLENAIRVCYNSFDKSDGTLQGSRDLIKKMIQNWHLDTLEHGSATFHVTCSRAAMSQFTRSRVASFGVESQRYVKYDYPNFLDVPHYDSGHLLYEEAVKIAFETYQKLIDDYGWKKEDARYVLPESWTTQFYVTMNFRSWRHFIELRCEKSSQWEIRGLAKSILKDLYANVPSCFEDLKQRFVPGAKIEVKMGESEENK
jgi:thymidylate synthase (FAD)